MSFITQERLAEIQTWTEDKYHTRGHRTGEMLRELIEEVRYLQKVAARQGALLDYIAVRHDIPVTAYAFEIAEKDREGQ